jgi:hypothetical protein
VSELTELKAAVLKIADDLGDLKVTAAKQEVNLAEHMRRTELAEKSIELLRSDVKPIQKHVAMLEGVLKALGILSVILGLIAGAIQFFKSF